MYYPVCVCVDINLIFFFYWCIELTEKTFVGWHFSWNSQLNRTFNRKLLFAHKQFLHSTSNTPLKCLEGESWNSFGDMFKQELEISFPERKMMIKAFPNARFAFVGKSKHISIERLSRVPWTKLMLTISKPKFNVQHGKEEGRKNVRKILAKNEIRLNEQRFHFHTFRKRTMWENVRSIVRNVIQLIIIIHSHAVQIDITFAFTDVHTPTIFVYFVWMRWDCDA